MTGRAASRILGLAMAIPPLAWFVYQQGLGDLLRADCARGGQWTGLAGGVLALAACLACVLCARLGWVSSERNAHRETVRLLGVLALSSAALFGLAIAYQMAASAIIPPCAR